jgi:hypothetical protein
MTTHSQTEKVAVQASHSFPQAFSPLGDVPSVCINSLTYSSVTFSTFCIPAADNVQQVAFPYEKHKDYRLGWLAWLIARKGRELAPMGVRVLGWMVLEAWQKEDRKMIVSHEELAFQMETETKVIRSTLDRLVAMKCLKVLVKGSCLKNQHKICSQYALGEVFEGIPPKMRGKNKYLHYAKGGRGERTPPLVQETMGGVHTHKGGEYTPPSPTSTLNTHTNNVGAGLNRETWLKRGKDKYPDWDIGNMLGAFHNAEAKRLNGTWPSYQDKCYHLRKTSPKEAPKVSVPQKDQKPKVVPSQPQRSQCESPRLAPIDYNDLKALEEQIYTAFKEGLSLEMIKASANPVLYGGAYKRAEARLS